MEIFEYKPVLKEKIEPLNKNKILRIITESASIYDSRGLKPPKFEYLFTNNCKNSQGVIEFYDVATFDDGEVLAEHVVMKEGLNGTEFLYMADTEGFDLEYARKFKEVYSAKQFKNYKFRDGRGAERDLFEG